MLLYDVDFILNRQRGESLKKSEQALLPGRWYRGLKFSFLSWQKIYLFFVDTLEILGNLGPTITVNTIYS